ARDRVGYVEDPIAAVAADTLDEARRALDAIEVEIEQTPAVCTIKDALREGAPLVHPDLKSYRMASDGEGGDYPKYGNVAAESATLGDDTEVDSAFASAGRVITDTFDTQRQYQGYIEPKNALGIYRGGRFIAHTGSQWPYNVRQRIA